MQIHKKDVKGSNKGYNGQSKPVEIKIKWKLKKFIPIVHSFYE